MIGMFKGMMEQLLEPLVSAAALVNEKGGEAEATGCRQWLLGVAEATAEAGKEGGFLGIGAVRVGDKEKAAEEELPRTLGLQGASWHQAGGKW